MLVVGHHHHRVGDVADVLEVERRIVERNVDGEPHRPGVERRAQVDDELQEVLRVVGLEFFEVQVHAAGADLGEPVHELLHQARARGVVGEEARRLGPAPDVARQVRQSRQDDRIGATEHAARLVVDALGQIAAGSGQLEPIRNDDVEIGDVSLEIRDRVRVVLHDEADHRVLRERDGRALRVSDELVAPLALLSADRLHALLLPGRVDGQRVVLERRLDQRGLDFRTRPERVRNPRCHECAGDREPEGDERRHREQREDEEGAAPASVGGVFEDHRVSFLDESRARRRGRTM